MYEPSWSLRRTTLRPPGCVVTVPRPDGVIVWLIGEIDVSLAPELADVAAQARPFARRLVIDASRLTYCDSTVASFIASMPDSMEVVVRRPSRLFADLLAATGLSDRLSMSTGSVC